MQARTTERGEMEGKTEREGEREKEKKSVRKRERERKRESVGERRGGQGQINTKERDKSKMQIKRVKGRKKTR
jgi:hypothetical protein